MRLLLLLTTLLVGVVSRGDAQTAAVQSGDWSDGATWGGSVPVGVEEDVTIPSGLTVTLDTNVECGTLLVEGTLLVARTDLELICDSLIVRGGAALFRAGTAGNRFTNRFVLTLKGDRNEDFQPSGHGSMGARALLALMGGTVSLHGEDRVEWTRLGANAGAGATLITMGEPVDWRPGDEILICSSRRDWNESEKRVVDSVSPDGLTVTLTEALSFPHCGVQKTYTRQEDGKKWTADLRAEVGLLSRNITIRGAADAVDEASPNYEFGAHVMIHGPMEIGGITMPTGKGYLQGVEIFRAGQLALLGRYPFHWHLCVGDAAGQYIKDCSIHKSFNRAIVVHGTDSTLVENNFCYDHIGHGIFLEDGAERFNTFRKNVVALTRRPEPGDELTPSDNEMNEVQNRTPASFWITNPNNTFVDNVAAGTEGTGYWFALPQSPMGLSGGLAYFSGLRPFREPLGEFSGNTAHSCMNGFDIFDQLSANHSIRRNGGWNHASLRIMNRCTWYSNHTAVYAGIGNTGFQDNVIYRDNVFVDNFIGLMLATYNIVEESAFIADSGENLLSGSRILYRVYDGPGQVRNSHLVGWDSPNANLVVLTGAATRHVNHPFSGISTDHEGTVRASLPNLDFVPGPDMSANDLGHPRIWSMVLRDLDGTLTGKANTSMVSNHPFLLVGDEYQAPNWTNVWRSDRKFVLGIDDPANTPRPNVSVIRSKPGTPTEGVYYIDGYNEHHQLPLIANEDFLYTYQYETLPSSRRISYELEDATPGDTVLLRYRDFGKLSGIRVTGHGAAARPSLEALEASSSTAYYVEPNGDLYLRPVATTRDQAMTIRWDANRALPPLDVDGDGVTDAGEAGRGRDPFHAYDFGAEFNMNGDRENWDVFANITNPTVSDGTLRGTSTGDSQILNRELNLDSSHFDQVLVRIRSDKEALAVLYWSRVDEPGFAGHLSYINYDTPGEWATLVFPVGDNPEWQGTIDAMRLDPTSGTSNFEIDFIRVLSSTHDADKDMIPDADEGFGDPDGDGITNLNDRDSDGDSRTDGQEMAENRNAYDGSDLAFQFDREADFEGWDVSARVTGKEVRGGSLRATTTEPNPVFLHRSIHVPAEEVPELLLRFKAEAAGYTRFFWNTDGEIPFSGSREIRPRYTNPGEWQLLRLPVSDHPDWTGKVTRLRLDPINVADTEFEIDWLRATGGPAGITDLSGTVPVRGVLRQGIMDHYEIELQGVSLVTVTVRGDPALAGSLYLADGTFLREVASPGAGGNATVFSGILTEAGSLSLLIEGVDTLQSGDYEVLVEVTDLPEHRPDGTIGKRLSQMRGDGIYNSSAAGQRFKLRSGRRRHARIYFQTQNDGGLPSVVTVQGTSGNRHFRAQYHRLSGGVANVTGAVKRSGYLANLDPLTSESFRLQVSPKRESRRKRKSFLINHHAFELHDRVQLQLRVRK